jgi:hypothetical protein
MLVREHDRGEALDVAADRFQPLFGLTGTESGIDQDRCSITLEPVGVPGATRTERGDDHGVDGNRKLKIEN